MLQRLALAGVLRNPILRRRRQCHAPLEARPRPKSEGLPCILAKYCALLILRHCAHAKYLSRELIDFSMSGTEVSLERGGVGVAVTNSLVFDVHFFAAKTLLSF